MILRAPPRSSRQRPTRSPKSRPGTPTPISPQNRVKRIHRSAWAELHRAAARCDGTQAKSPTERKHPGGAGKSHFDLPKLGETFEGQSNARAANRFDCFRGCTDTPPKSRPPKLLADRFPRSLGFRSAAPTFFLG